MRPEILFPLFAPVTKLPGIGPRIAKLVEKAAGAQIVDLLWHLPTGIIDRRYAPKIADATPGRVATITVQIDRHVPAANKRLPYKVLCSDATGSMVLVFFHARADYLRRTLPEGEQRVVSGSLDKFGGELQMAHPDHIGKLDELERLKTVEPVYPLTQGLSLKVLAKAITGALGQAPDLDEWLDAAYIKRQGWPAWSAAIGAAHAPAGEAALAPTMPERARLAFDELLANQLALALVRINLRRARGRAVEGDGGYRKCVVDALPFKLTGAQVRTLQEITGDMASPLRMHRLLQGDVGAGKTIVALLAMLAAVEAGAQAALLAPTEILTRQHFANIQELIEPLRESQGIEIALLTGREKGKTREGILARLASGETHLVIGTHALFQEHVEFHDLAFVVVDEQHRFGVHQRLALAEKGQAPDVLVMTATPIPRTLTLTFYGDMDVSKLDEKPAGRQPIQTRTISLARLDDVVGAARRALGTGARIYWVCPLVEESETLDLAAAEDRYAHLRSVFGESVGLVHGRMKGADKDAVMAAFAEGGIQILVATTVIEVGVDVPEATVMIVEHAERFGLAQLHQLRGRIGRGAETSTCLLLYGPALGEGARARLNILKDTEDGFRIAEEDLRLRGAGELMGARQSGMPAFRMADMAVHGELLAAARDDARLIIERDPELTGARGAALRVLLYLFERDSAVRLLRSG
ncbi:MAG: ATP-dependent DNA helicase RecG [Rhodospirillaceae bacterium]|jgi:ATP-dependent DNA helicase RecG|nr:ATP-dependent DNA helicase RecG [Rhodospirillaceae bacterium]MDP6643185.1 ATP-dependent DNA helicase RecG [Rhodospirillales bacterium]